MKLSENIQCSRTFLTVANCCDTICSSFLSSIPFWSVEGKCALPNTHPWDIFASTTFHLVSHLNHCKAKLPTPTQRNTMSFFQKCQFPSGCETSEKSHKVGMFLRPNSFSRDIDEFTGSDSDHSIFSCSWKWPAVHFFCKQTSIDDGPCWKSGGAGMWPLVKQWPSSPLLDLHFYSTKLDVQSLHKIFTWCLFSC